MHQGATSSEGREHEALCDFLEQWHEDRAGGAIHGLAHYLARFPDAEAAVAREFLRLVGAALPERAEPAPSLAAERPRYERLGTLARGGMGLVERVRDHRLERDLARKSALRTGLNARLRFEKEARLTGQLDHPGIVPVHDVGADPDGVPWFTMRLVGGRDLREIIQLVHTGDPEWSLTAALGVLLRVCETVAYAHSRGVVHRDLKPANVRVGRYGEVYVMDWGLARAEHQPDVDDLRLRLEPGAGEGRDSLLLTMDGDVVGTPCTMSPEQAEGRLEDVGPRSDVYSVGAMLYELLSGHMPYVAEGESVSSKDVLDRVLTGPPTPLSAVAPNAPAELAAICEKAMSREPARRYVDMRDMASDVRAYLEGRVVRAYRTGVRAEAGKWIARNRWLTVAIGAGVTVAVAALVVLAVDAAQDRARLTLQADSRAPADLVSRAGALTRGRPEDAAALRAWLDEAREVLAHLPAYEREAAALRDRALPRDPNHPRELAAERNRRVWLAGFDRVIQHYEGELEAMRRDGRRSDEGLSEDEVKARLVMLAADRASYEARPVVRHAYTFAREADTERYEMIERLLEDVAPLLPSGDVDDGLVALMQRRHDEVATLAQRSLVDAGEAWERAARSIANRDECPQYEGLVLTPQLGLVPLGRDPATGLWEFVHVASGAAPERGRVGPPREEDGIVLVLVPRARVTLGAQPHDPALAPFDPEAQASEWTLGEDGRPVLLDALLAPFFIGKYEVSQAQWRRIAGKNPSIWTPARAAEAVRGLTHPVEGVDWLAALRGLEAVGLTLPTEAQWEYAARGGTDTPWWTGRDREALLGAANLADARYAAYRAEQWGEPVGEVLPDDGFRFHAPVGSLRANGFGLHDVCGNVNEWCLDAGFIGYDKPHEVLIDTFERRIAGEGLRVRRGGSFDQRPSQARSAARQFKGPEHRGQDTGLRAARSIEP